jgi:hypothetical protein
MLPPSLFTWFTVTHISMLNSNHLFDQQQLGYVVQKVCHWICIWFFFQSYHFCKTFLMYYWSNLWSMLNHWKWRYHLNRDGWSVSLAAHNYPHPPMCLDDKLFIWLCLFQIAKLQDDNRALDRLTKQKEAALLEAERTVEIAMAKAAMVDDLQNKNQDLMKQIEICHVCGCM